MHNNIIILGQHVDPHIIAVCKELSYIGIEPIIIDRFNHDFITLQYFYDHANVYAHKEKFDMPSSVLWSRLKPNFAADPKVQFSSEQREIFWEGQWQRTLRSIPSFLIKCRQVNIPENSVYASKKPHQLFAAQQIGFHIPKTIITNNFEDILEHIPSQSFIYKPVSDHNIDNHSGLPTMLVTRNQIKEFSEQLRRAPGIFQEYIEKEYELRVSVFGDRVFSTKIKSQNYDEATIDWRLASLQKEMYEPISLDSETNALIRTYMDYFGLDMGMFDLIVTPDGETVFLECNPEGQWLWIEHFTGQEMSKAMARLLTGADLLRGDGHDSSLLPEILQSRTVDS